MDKPFLEDLRSAVRRHLSQIQESEEESIQKLSQAGINSFEALISATMDNTLNREVRQAACWALGKLKKKRAAHALLTVFSERNPDLYWESAKSLGLLASKRVVQPLIKVLQDDPDVDKRAAAAYALGLIADERSTETLLNIVNNPNEPPKVRGYAVESLSHMERNDKIIDTLINCLKDPHPELQFWAAFTLGELGDPRAIPALERLASTSQDMLPEWGKVSQEARDAIAAIREREK